MLYFCDCFIDGCGVLMLLSGFSWFGLLVG